MVGFIKSSQTCKLQPRVFIFLMTRKLFNKAGHPPSSHFFCSHGCIVGRKTNFTNLQDQGLYKVQIWKLVKNRLKIATHLLSKVGSPLMWTHVTIEQKRNERFIWPTSSCTPSFLVPTWAPSKWTTPTSSSFFIESLSSQLIRSPTLLHTMRINSGLVWN